MTGPAGECNECLVLMDGWVCRGVGGEGMQGCRDGGIAGGMERWRGGWVDGWRDGGALGKDAWLSWEASYRTFRVLDSNNYLCLICSAAKAKPLPLAKKKKTSFPPSPRPQICTGVVTTRPFVDLT